MILALATMPIDMQVDRQVGFSILDITNLISTSSVVATAVKSTLDSVLPDLSVKYPDMTVAIETKLGKSFPIVPPNYLSLLEKENVRVMWRPGKTTSSEFVKKAVLNLLPGIVIGFGAASIIYFIIRK